MARTLHTTKSIAKEVGAAGWLVRRLVDQVAPDCARLAGNCRVLDESEAERVRTALRLIGFNSERELQHA